MNNFYASVECMLDPSLRKYPVAVCGSVEERHGIVLAKNYAAKAFDVKTGDAVWQAKQKCRNLVVVPPHFEEYIKYSKLARSVYSRYTDQVEPYGMDECWLDVSGTENIFGSPEKVANDIRETIKFELGLTISVGVSFNKIFAKLGSDMKKPDAVTVIPKDTFRDKIWGLPAADLLGVGRATQRVLDSYCIRTIGDLAKTDPDFLNRRLGKNGIALWQYANGNDRSRVMNADFVSPVKSVGHGITTIEDLENDEQVWPVFLELTQDIGHKLRVHQKCADGVAIHIRDNTLFSKQWQTALDMPTQSPMLIAKAAFALFEKRYDWRNPIRSVTIQAINLVPQDTPRQVDLFMNIEKIEKAERLDQCIETIRQRFGKNSIRNGILFQNLRMPSEKPEITMPTGDAVVKGGRYNNLLKQFGKDAPSIGFAFTVEELIMAMNRQNIDIDVDYSNTIILYDIENQGKAIKAGMKLRSEGRKIELIRKSQKKSVDDYIEYAGREHFSGLIYFEQSGDAVAYDLISRSHSKWDGNL